jgi:hypothetical protein
MAEGGGARPRFGRILVLGTLVGVAAAGAVAGPRMWDALSGPGEPLAGLKRKWDTWRGYAQFKDKRIQRVVNGIDRQPRAKGGTKTPGVPKP